jgi:predicted oxidoreductase
MRPVDAPHDMSSGELNTFGCRHVDGYASLPSVASGGAVGAGRAAVMDIE